MSRLTDLLVRAYLPLMARFHLVERTAAPAAAKPPKTPRGRRAAALGTIRPAAQVRAGGDRAAALAA